MVYVGPGYSIIRPTWITPLFVGFDVLAIATQGIGSALIFGTDLDINKLSRGRTILIVGLFIQLVAFAIFLLLTLYFDRKTTVALRERVASIRPLLNAFYLSGALILLRSIYRAIGECAFICSYTITHDPIEFITVDFYKRPINSYLYNTEWPYYVLDALPIAVSPLAHLLTKISHAFIARDIRVQYPFPRQVSPKDEGRDLNKGRPDPYGDQNREWICREWTCRKRARWKWTCLREDESVFIHADFLGLYLEPILIPMMRHKCSRFGHSRLVNDIQHHVDTLLGS